METDEKTAALWLDGLTNELTQAVSREECVTLPGFGGFYVERKRDGTAFKFNPSQKLRAILGWSSTYKGVFCCYGRNWPRPRNYEPLIYRL